MMNPPASQENKDSQSGALADVVRLARLSRLLLLYLPAATARPAGRDGRGAPLPTPPRHAVDGDLVVTFDAGGEPAGADLLGAIEAAVLEAARKRRWRRHGQPVEAPRVLAAGARMHFLLIVQRVDLALARPDPEFEEVLLNWRTIRSRSACCC